MVRSNYQEVFSIVMPCFNSESFIFDSILSVKTQSYTNWRLYVIDDCSTDSSVDIVHKLSLDDSRIRLIRLTKNSGVAIARNVGIDKASGKYIAFLDSDDLWHRHKLEAQLKILESGYNVLCSNYSAFVNSTSTLGRKRVFPELITYNKMLTGNKIGNLTGVYNQSVLGKVYQVNSGHEDYIMWLELVRRAKFAYCIQDVLAYYRVSPTSLSANKLKASQWQWCVYRDYQKMGFFISLYYWSRYVINAVFR